MTPFLIIALIGLGVWIYYAKPICMTCGKKVKRQGYNGICKECE